MRKNSHMVRGYYKSVEKVPIVYTLTGRKIKPNTTFYILYKGKLLKN